MIISPDLQELAPIAQRINLLERNDHLEPLIEIPGIQLGADKWPEMLQQTQADGEERGANVSQILGRIVTSKIIKGALSENRRSVRRPLFPHGIKSLLPITKDLTHIHSHTMPKDLDHLQTSLFSDGDVRGFVESNLKALVMIDRGGVHVLLRSFLAILGKLLPNFNLSEAAINESKKGESTVATAMKQLATTLYPYGISYYYSPNLEPTSDGHIRLRDVRTISPKTS